MIAGKGNRHKQQFRRRRNNKHTPKQDVQYQMIDGNMTYYPHAYCTWHKGWLTCNMAKCHQCKEKQCSHYHETTDRTTYPLMSEYFEPISTCDE